MAKGEDVENMGVAFFSPKMVYMIQNMVATYCEIIYVKNLLLFVIILNILFCNISICFIIIIILYSLKT